jgi:hypothetical protein
MKRLKLFLIGILMALMPCLAKAQDINIDSIAELNAKDLKKYFDKFDDTKWQNFINNLDVINFPKIVNKLDDSKLSQRFIFQLEESRVTEVSLLNEDIKNLEQDIAEAKAKISDIDNFLNIQDTSIFKSKFVEFDLKNIPLRDRNDYLLIENIHTLDTLLVTIETKISDKLKSSGLEIKKGANPEIVNILIKKHGCLDDDIKKDIDEALQIINNIADIEQGVKDGLYPEQNNYRKSIANRCLELSEICSNE